MTQPQSLLTQAELDSPDFVLLDRPEAVTDWIPKLSHGDSAIAIDTETNGDNPRQHRVCLIQVGVIGFPICLIDIRTMTLTDLRPLAELLQQPRLKLFQNGKFDLKMLNAMGLLVAGPYFDTLLASRVLRCGQNEAHGLGDLTKFYLGLTMDKGEQTSFLSLGDDPLTESQCRYGSRDVKVLPPLWAVQQTALHSRQRDQAIVQLEQRLLPVLVAMELKGFSIHTVHLQQLTQTVAAQVEGIKQDVLRQLCPGDDRTLSLFGGTATSKALNLNSPTAVKAALAEVGLEPDDTPKGLLKQVNKHPAVYELLTYKHGVKQQAWLKKLRDSVVEGRVYANYNQCPRQTGRLENSLKWEQWTEPLAVLTLVQPTPGASLLWADLRLLPLHLLAQAAGDERLLHDLKHLKAGDTKALVAMGCGVYGYRSSSLQHWLWENGQIVSLNQATKEAKAFFDTYAGVPQYHQTVKASDFYKPTWLRRYRRLEAPGQKPSLSDRISQIFLTGASDLLKQVLVSLPSTVTPLMSCADGLLVEGGSGLKADCQSAIQAQLQDVCLFPPTFHTPSPREV